jgi:hypothetical protein
VPDTRQLLAGLIEYRAALERHVQGLRQEYDGLDLRWRSFGAVYEGDAADQFKYGWDRTTSRFRYYLERTTAIARVLDERIEALREANQQESSLL